MWRELADKDAARGMGIVGAGVAAWLSRGSVAHAQSMMRTPSLNIGSRVPTINPTMAPRVNPIVGAGSIRSIAGRVIRIAVTTGRRTSVGSSHACRRPQVAADRRPLRG